jgi:hypothetical protein
MTADEALEELIIGERCTISQKHGPAKVLDERGHRAGCHFLSFGGATDTLYLTTTRTRQSNTLFFCSSLNAAFDAGSKVVKDSAPDHTSE